MPHDDTKTRRHYIGRRAHRLIEQIRAEGFSDDDQLDTKELAAVTGNSPQFYEIGRSRGYGPPYLKLGPCCVRYRWGDVRQWLEQCARQSTSEYKTAGGRPRKARETADAAV